MKTIKISIVATMVSILAWLLRVPHRLWPEHPQFMDFLLAVVLCVVLQLVWADSASKPDKKPES